MRSIELDNLRSSQGLSPISDEFSPIFPNPRFGNMKESGNFMYTEPGFMKPINVEQTQIIKHIPQKVMNIVLKPYQERTASQNMLTGRFLLGLSIFKQLTQNLSQEVVRQMVKDGKLKLYEYGDLITTQGNRVRCVRILISGQVGILQKQQKEEEREEKNAWDILNELVDKLGRESRNFKTKTNIHRMSSFEDPLRKSCLSRQQTDKQGQIIQKQYQTITGQKFLNHQNLLEYEPENARSLIVTENNTLIFNLNIEDFYESLLLFHTSKQNQVLKLFRRVSFFNLFQNSRLKQLVQKMKVKQLKKGQLIYKEGDDSNCFYLLTEGEVQITKTIGLFQENPNNLYKNRIKMSRQKLNLNIKSLPYADFKGVYNYQQQEKLITLAVINGVSIFGQEQILDSKPRQVNAKVLSLKAKMYQINLSIVQDFLNKMTVGPSQKKISLADFFGMIEQSVTLKKILFRQNQLSQMVEHQNKSKFRDIFEDSEKKRQSYKLKSAYSKRRASAGGFFNKKEEQEAPPTFNNFNFTDFMNESQEKSPMIVSNCFSEDEEKVVSLTHQKYRDQKNSQKSKQKTIRLRHYSNTRSSKDKQTIDKLATIQSLTSSTIPLRQKSRDAFHSSQSITLDQPLFTIKYFRSQHEKQKRLVAVAKKKKLETIYRNSENMHAFH